MATICAIADSSLENKFFSLNAPWLYGNNESDDNPKINGFVTSLDVSLHCLSITFFNSLHIQVPSYSSNLVAHIHPWNSSTLVKLLSSILTPTFVTTKPTRLRKPGLGICQIDLSQI